MLNILRNRCDGGLIFIVQWKAKGISAYKQQSNPLVTPLKIVSLRCVLRFYARR